MDMQYKQIKNDYARLSKTIEENSMHMEAAVVNLATTATEVKSLAKSIQEMARINEKEHGKLEAEDRALHARVTNAVNESTKLAGNIKTSIAEKIGDLKVADKQNEGKLRSKLDIGEMLKLLLLLSTTLGIFKYLLPALGGQ